MRNQHTYTTMLNWTGNTGTGTSGYRGYERSFTLATSDNPEIAGSSDPLFRGNPARWNPEELLVGAISACHQLWFLHLCSDAGIVVESYRDAAEGTMNVQPDGTGQFTGVTLHPVVVTRNPADQSRLAALHAAAHVKCVIAQSVKFPVLCEGVDAHE